MANVALRKPVEEPMKNSGAATDGNSSDYTGLKGFADFPWPNTLTVDLGGTYDLHCIRFLLWDGLGQGGGRRNLRVYKYRLLVSEDHHTWTVLYDTRDDGYNGWQSFEFEHTIQAQYIRVHGLWNSANSNFHIVQIEAHDSQPPPLGAEITLYRRLSTDSFELESGEGLPLTSRMRDIIRKIDDLVAENSILNPEPFQELTSELRVRVGDIGAVESSMGSIRRAIIAPVQDRLEQSMKLGQFSVWGFWVGLIGGILAIVSLVINLLT